MNWWEWFFASLLGAVIVKALDLFYKGIVDSVSTCKLKIDTLSEYIDNYSDLLDLFRYYEHSSYELIHPNDEPITERNISETIVQSNTLEPEDEFLETISIIQGISFDQLIAKSVYEIMSNQTRNLILADELNPSGGLRTKFSELYRVTILKPQTILKQKNSGDPLKSDKLFS